MTSNTNTSSTNKVFPVSVSTKDNSGYIITSVVKSTAGPGGCVLVTTKEELRFLVTNQTSEIICVEQPKVPKCAPCNHFTFPTAILPISSPSTKVCNTTSGKDISTQTQSGEIVEKETKTVTTVKKENISAVNGKCPCSKKETGKKKKGKPASKPKKKRTQTTHSKQRSQSISSSSSCSESTEDSSDSV